MFKLHGLGAQYQTRIFARRDPILPLPADAEPTRLEMCTGTLFVVRFVNFLEPSILSPTTSIPRRPWRALTGRSVGAESRWLDLPALHGLVSERIPVERRRDRHRSAIAECDPGGFLSAPKDRCEPGGSGDRAGFRGWDAPHPLSSRQNDLPGRSASAGVKFAADSLLEGAGFEPSVPRPKTRAQSG